MSHEDDSSQDEQITEGGDSQDDGGSNGNDKRTTLSKCHRALLATCSIVFYGLAYTPFCISILLYVAFTNKAVDPSNWNLSFMRNYWYSSILFYLILLVYALSALHLLIDDTIGAWIWPMFCPTLLFHLLTVRYVLLRPELCTLGEHLSHRPLRWKNPRNWLGIIFAILEFFQLMSIPFGGQVPWFGNDSQRNGVLQDILRACLTFSNKEIANLVFVMTIVVAFGLLVGEFIRSERCASDPGAGILYNILSGGLFLTTLGALFKVARVTVVSWRQSAVLVGLLLYTTPSVFVSVYRGNLREIKSDIAYAPLLLSRERVSKELFALVVVYYPTNIVGRLCTVFGLGGVLLFVFRSPLQYSCPTFVHLRRFFIGISMWSSISALFVVNGLRTVGLSLLGVGYFLLIVVAIWKRPIDTTMDTIDDDESESTATLASHDDLLAPALHRHVVEDASGDGADVENDPQDGRATTQGPSTSIDTQQEAFDGEAVVSIGSTNGEDLCEKDN